MFTSAAASPDQPEVDLAEAPAPSDNPAAPPVSRTAPAAGPGAGPDTSETPGAAGTQAPGENGATGATSATAAGARSLERMARFRHLVRKEGMDVEAAAHEVGIDPIIGQLWLRLPDDLLNRGAPSPTASPAAQLAPSPVAPTTVRPATPPTSGLRRVLTCRIPAPAYDRLRSGEAPLLDAAAAALEAGLAQPRPPVAPGGWRFTRRVLAVPVPGAAYAAVVHLAEEAFDGDPREAAGWLIARGLGMALPLPTADELAAPPAPPVASLSQRTLAPAVRFMVPPRRRPEVRAPLPPDDSAPNGDELRTRREAVGISQRDLAAASGLSRGLIAEVERGRRRHVLTRLKIAETLASLARSKGAEAPQ